MNYPKGTLDYIKNNRFHPDRNPGDESAHAKFLEINQAYSILSNDLSRREYDLTLESPSATRRNVRTRRQDHIRPDDWILYRKSTAQQYQRMYDFKTHQSTHYPDISGQKRDKEKYDAFKRQMEYMRQEKRSVSWAHD